MADHLEIPTLRSFVAIAEYGGFGRAAFALGLGQSTVSQHVRQLERTLDLALVQKHGRGTRFTPAGDQLLIEARRLIAAHDSARRRLAASTEAPAITVGATETAVDELLPELLARIRAEYPQRRVQFRIDRSSQMVKMLETGEIDVAVLLGYGAEAPGTQLGTLPLKWFTSARTAGTGGGGAIGQEPVELVAYTEPCGMRQRALKALDALGCGVEITAESGNLEGVIAGARAGLGLAVLPTAGRVPAGLVERVDLPALEDIGVYLSARRGVSGAVFSAAEATLRAFFAR